MLIENLGLEDREKIKELCQKLFHGNYIPEYIFSPNEQLRKYNMDYHAILSNFGIISELLEICGWQLNRDDNAGVIYITSDYQAAKATLSKIESYFLFALRMIYDQKKTTASATGQVFILVSELIEQLSSLDALEQISKQERKKSLTTLKNKNIISRISGDLSELDAKIAILPSILCVISSNKVATLKTMLEENKTNEAEMNEDD